MTEIDFLFCIDGSAFIEQYLSVKLIGLNFKTGINVTSKIMIGVSYN